jgi:hypothetical protein
MNDLEAFLTWYKNEVLEKKRILALDILLKETPTRWWGVHKEIVKYWYQCKRLLSIRFGAEQGSTEMNKYDRNGARTEPLDKCREL